MSTITRVRTVPYAPSADRGTQPSVPFGQRGQPHAAPTAPRPRAGA